MDENQREEKTTIHKELIWKGPYMTSLNEICWHKWNHKQIKSTADVCLDITFT